MTYKMYLVSISGLEEECLKEAMCLLDSYRKELVHKYKNDKDRMRAIVAGLLLQTGFLELEPAGEFCRVISVPEDEASQAEQFPKGQCFVLECKGFVEYLKELAKDKENMFPMELVYGKGEHGKPFWNRNSIEADMDQRIYQGKKLWHFNLSHSGDYVVLAVSDAEIGVDIQEPREAKSFSGGYKEFSRMEAFVKCTGAGYAYGISAYKEAEGRMPGYEILSFDLIEDYALHICFQK